MTRPKFSGFKERAQRNKLVAAPLCFCAFLCAGCFTAKRPAFHYTAAGMSRPVLPAAGPAAASEEIPNISMEMVLPPRFVAVRGPVRPRSAIHAGKGVVPQKPAE